MSRKILYLRIGPNEFEYGAGFSILQKHTSFPNEENKLRPGLIWKTEILEYNSEDCILYLKVIDFNCKDLQEFQSQKPKTQLNWIDFEKFPLEKILSCLVFKDITLLTNHIIDGDRLKSKLQENKQGSSNNSYGESIILDHIYKEVEYPIKKINFEDGYGEFKISRNYFHGLMETQICRIPNSIIRREYQVVLNYLIKAFGSRKIKVTLEIGKRSDGNYVLLGLKSVEFENIDDSLIKKACYMDMASQIKKYRKDNPEVLVPDQSISFPNSKNSFPPFNSRLFLENLLEDRPEIHYYELSYLSKRQVLVPELGLQFILQPQFSFLFMIQVKQTLFWVLETYQVDLATYIWTTPYPEKSNDHVTNIFKDQISSIYSEIKKITEIGRNQYKKAYPENFDFVEHHHGKNGFLHWRAAIEELIPLENK